MTFLRITDEVVLWPVHVHRHMHPQDLMHMNTCADVHMNMYTHAQAQTDEWRPNSFYLPPTILCFQIFFSYAKRALLLLLLLLLCFPETPTVFTCRLTSHHVSTFGDLEIIALQEQAEAQQLWELRCSFQDGKEKQVFSAACASAHNLGCEPWKADAHPGRAAPFCCFCGWVPQMCTGQHQEPDLQWQANPTNASETFMNIPDLQNQVCSALHMNELCKFQLRYLWTVIRALHFCSAIFFIEKCH